eukprot:288341-Chlamydomonas_euryale.AAC.1
MHGGPPVARLPAECRWRGTAGAAVGDTRSPSERLLRSRDSTDAASVASMASDERSLDAADVQTGGGGDGGGGGA